MAWAMTITRRFLALTPPRPLLALLPVRDKRILHLSFFREMTRELIGTELGVSQMQISRLLAAIPQRLRQGADCEATS